MVEYSVIQVRTREKLKKHTHTHTHTLKSVSCDRLSVVCTALGAYIGKRELREAGRKKGPSSTTSADKRFYRKTQGPVGRGFSWFKQKLEHHNQFF